MSLQALVQRAKRLPLIGRSEFARLIYHKLVDIRGAKVRAGGINLRIPAFFNRDWQRYEPDTTAVFAEWIRAHPGAMILDIGSAIGIFSAIGLFADKTAEVYAFDADLASVAATRRLCSYSTGNRLKSICAFISDASSEKCSASDAVKATNRKLKETKKFGETQYASMSSEDYRSVPRYALDELFPRVSRAVLIKCDIEGAEFLMLRGAERLIRFNRPDFLLSVHPRLLPDFGHSVDHVRRFLEERDYSIKTIAIDHEEHWLVTHG